MNKCKINNIKKVKYKQRKKNLNIKFKMMKFKRFNMKKNFKVNNRN